MEVIGQVRGQSFRKKGKVFVDKKDLFILYICQYFNFLFGYIVAGAPKHPTPTTTRRQEQVDCLLYST